MSPSLLRVCLAQARMIRHWAATDEMGARITDFYRPADTQVTYNLKLHLHFLD